MPPGGLQFPLKDAFEKINKDIFNPLLNDPEFDEDEEAKRARGLPDLEQEPIPHEDDARGPADTGLSSLFHELPGPVHDEPIGAPLASDEGVVAEASGLQHFRHGLASDDKIYRNDHGERVKLDKRGKPYRVDADGIRKLPTHRPEGCLLYTSPSPRDRQKSRMPSSA